MQKPASPVPRGWLSRIVHGKLIAPLRRSRHTPEYTARGVLVGLLVALTPTVGVQMPIVFGIWLALRKMYPGWDFNVVVALAWTWVTNAVTAPFVY